MFLQNLKKPLLKLIPIFYCLVFTVNGAVIVPKAPKIPVKSYVLMEVNTGKMIAKLEENKHIQPASIVKLMTAYSTFLDLDEGRIGLLIKLRSATKLGKQKARVCLLNLG